MLHGCHLPVSPQLAQEACQRRPAAPDGGSRRLGAQRQWAQGEAGTSICCGHGATGQGASCGSELPVRAQQVRPPVVDVVKDNPVLGGQLRDTSVVSAYLEIPRCSCSQNSGNG